MLVLLLSSIAAVSGFGNPRHAVSSRPRRVAKARLEMVFMSECPLRENALNWAKESRLRAQIKGVVALFDEREKPVYVGCFDDAAFAVAALTKKHGVETIAGVRVEEFPGVDEDDFGVKLMRGLAASWLKEATEMNDGVVPVGNADGEWDEFDADSNPFLFAVIGQDGQAPSPLGADSPESDAEERLQQRRESLKTKLDQAIEDNDQATAEKLLSRLSSNLLSDDDDEMLRWFFVLTAVSGLQPSHQPQQQQQKVATRGQFVSFGSLCAALMAPMSANALNPMMSEKKKKGSVSYYEEPPAYLTEPTEEFKKAEADRAKFRQQQAAYKKKWDEVFSEFVASASNDDKLVSSLSDLTKLVSSQRGLPYGLRLSDMITQCRRVKSKASQAGGWGTPVEIEYMNLVREVKRAENPNLSVENTGYL